MSKVVRITDSGIVKRGMGKIKGCVVNSHTSGTLKLLDGLESSAVAATSTLTWANAGSSLVSGKHGASTITSTGASVAATHATGTLTVSGGVNFKDAVAASGVVTSDETTVSDGDVIALGSIEYRFKTTPVQAYDVAIGSSAADNMINLVAAINGTGDWRQYNQSTVPHPEMTAVLTSTYVVTVTAKTAGTAGNSLAKTLTATHLDWDGAGAEMSGGLAAETVTIGTKVYTFRDTLTVPAVANEVKIGSTPTASLLNLKYAINATSGYAGTSYSTGTVAHTQVVAYTSNATTCVIKGRVVGSSLDTVATTETCAAAAFGGTTLVDAVAITSSTVTIGDVVYTQVDVLSETYGADAVPYEFLRGATEATMLDALKAAINGTSQGTLCGTGTVAHPYVIATTNADDSQVIMTRTVGNAAHTAILNALVTEETLGNTAWTGADIANGTQAAVTTDDALITIGTRIYSVVQELSETSGADAVADQILFGANDGVFLDNVKKAINETGTAGTEYSTGTTINTQVSAGANAATTQVITAKQLGAAGNLIATTETCAQYSWTSTVMASGVGSTADILFNTITFTAEATTGERSFDFGNISFERGLCAVVGGTADISLIID